MSGISVYLGIRFSTKEQENLCFKHAVEVSLKGTAVEVEIGDKEDLFYVASSYCVLCSDENKSREDGK